MALIESYIVTITNTSLSQDELIRMKEDFDKKYGENCAFVSERRNANGDYVTDIFGLTYSKERNKTIITDVEQYLLNKKYEYIENEFNWVESPVPEAPGRADGAVRKS